MTKAPFILFIAALAVLGFLFLGGNSEAMQKGADLMTEKPTTDYPSVTLAGGCFWCTESEYRALDGVLYTRVGYMGGKIDNPTYRDITTGRTGHAEVVRVTFDPEKLTYEELLTFFLTKAHDPTQLNRQGVDVGTQYRSAIFYKDEDEKQAGQAVIETAQANFKKPIVTTLEPEATFWDGEDYHQQYYEKYQEETGKTHIRVIQKQAKKKAKGLIQ